MDVVNGNDGGPRPTLLAKRTHGTGTTLNPRGAKSSIAMTLRLCDGLRVLCVKTAMALRLPASPSGLRRDKLRLCVKTCDVMTTPAAVWREMA